MLIQLGSQACGDAASVRKPASVAADVEDWDAPTCNGRIIQTRLQLLHKHQSTTRVKNSFICYNPCEVTRGTASTLYVGKPSPKSSAQKLTVTEMFHKSSIEDFVPLVSTAKRDKPLEWRPFWPSREHPLLLALGQQSETRLWARGLPTYFCLLRMLKPRTGSPTVVGLMWAGCRDIHSSSLWRQRVTSGEGRTTTPSRGDVLFVLFNCPCHDVVR